MFQRTNLPQTLQATSTQSGSDDEDRARSLFLANLSLMTHDAFKSLESLQLELKLLTLAKSNPPPPPAERDEHDLRTPKSQRVESVPSFNPSGSKLAIGQLLSSSGRPLQPITILGDRTDRQARMKGVFRPGHNLPTMTIDEYLEEEKRRGGIISGGTTDGVRPEVDEDDDDAADRDTMKKREWDNFTEANPRGAGNTINRG